MSQDMIAMLFIFSIVWIVTTIWQLIRYESLEHKVIKGKTIIIRNSSYKATITNTLK